MGVIYIMGNNVKQICGRYDVNENELILSVTMDTNGTVEKEILQRVNVLTPHITPHIM